MSLTILEDNLQDLLLEEGFASLCLARALEQEFLLS